MQIDGWYAAGCSCLSGEQGLGTPYILYTKDIMLKDGIWHLPLYMAMFL